MIWTHTVIKLFALDSQATMLFTQCKQMLQRFENYDCKQSNPKNQQVEKNRGTFAGTRNAGMPKRRNTKTRNTKLLKPGTHEK